MQIRAQIHLVTSSFMLGVFKHAERDPLQRLETGGVDLPHLRPGGMYIHGNAIRLRSDRTVLNCNLRRYFVS